MYKIISKKYKNEQKTDNKKNKRIIKRIIKLRKAGAIRQVFKRGI